jgi:hypothetical protein
MRSFLAILTIIALLVCPLDCATKRAIAQSAGQENQKACCNHCSEKHNKNSSESPACPEPSSNQEGRSCICKGAIYVASEPTLNFGSLDLATWVWIDCPLGTSISYHVHAAEVRDGEPPPWQGRDRRIAIHSLLI